MKRWAISIDLALKKFYRSKIFLLIGRRYNIIQIHPDCVIFRLMIACFQTNHFLFLLMELDKNKSWRIILNCPVHERSTWAELSFRLKNEPYLHLVKHMQHLTTTTITPNEIKSMITVIEILVVDQRSLDQFRGFNHRSQDSEHPRQSCANWSRTVCKLLVEVLEKISTFRNSFILDSRQGSVFVISSSAFG